MASFTQHFGLQRLRAGLDTFSTNGSKYTDEDRVIIDRLLFLALSGHHHDGVVPDDVNPTDPPELALDIGGGLPAGERIYYVYTLVDANGAETAPSPEAWVDTPAPVNSPEAPALARASTGGTLMPGAYFYGLSAYTGSNTLDTRVMNYGQISIPAGTNTNKITILLPDLPSGADGFNIYRRKPGNAEYFYLDSVDMGGTPPTEYVDDGGEEEDCDRRPSTSNATNSDNSVIVQYPGATPAIPEGYTWKVYRSYTSGVFYNALLQWVVEETEEASGIIVTEIIDVGQGTQPGNPPAASQIVESPSKVNLGTETEGTLPPHRINGFPILIEFSLPGVTTVAEGPEIWISPYPALIIKEIRVNAGWDEADGEFAWPESASVNLSVMKSSDGVTWADITNDDPLSMSPFIPITNTTPNAPTGPDPADRPELLVLSDMLRVDVTQADADAADLRVIITAWVQVPDPVTLDWPE